MPRRHANPYVPHDWAPHEKPAILGSPSTPIHSTPKRIAYGIVGLLVCLTGALGNAVVTANLQLLQGTFAAWSTEIAWLPAVYVMTNVSINLLLVKFRQQFGLRAFTEGFLVLYVLVTFFHLFVCGEVIVYAWMDRRRENSEKPYGTRLGAGQAVSARLVGK